MREATKVIIDRIEDGHIINIANEYGKFCVSLRWRDINLQKQCNRLCKEGYLKNIGRAKREIIFVPVKQHSPGK